MGPGQAALLGFVQGISEFLPISSSGHLVIVQALLGVKNPGATFEVLVHFGTLLAIFAVFRQEVAALLAALARFPGLLLRGRWGGMAADRDVRLLLLIVLGSIPAGLAGFIGRKSITALFDRVETVGFALLVTGVLLWASDRIRPGRTGLAGMGPAQTVAIGLAQALALVPGISRSGSTITVGLFSGLSRDAAGRFSFLLAIPAILGATVLELGELGQTGLSAASALAGVATAAVSGYLSLQLLLRFVRAGKLRYFAYYTWLVGAAVLLMGRSL